MSANKLVMGANAKAVQVLDMISTELMVMEIGRKYYSTNQQ
jgi:hypothetical protein